MLCRYGGRGINTSDSVVAAMRRIENDEQYFRSLDWLLEKAKELDHPLIDERTKAELMQKYDFVAAGVMEYQQRKPEPSTPEPDPPKPEPEPEPEPQKKVDLSDWLDD